MRSAVRKFGNSAGVIIPKPLLTEIGARAGDSVDLRVEDGRIVIETLAASPRRGWADDARRLAVEGDDAPLWPDIANDEDETLVW